jgi:hypothetical protein
MRPALVLVWIGLLIALTAPVCAHPGYEHFVGPVTAVDDQRVELKVKDATVAFTLTLRTRYLRRGKPVPHAELAVGARVVVDARRERGVWIASEIRFVVEPK